MGNTLTAMSGMGAEALADATARFAPLRDQVVREAVAVALALGVSVEPIGGRPARAWLEDGVTLQSAAPPAGSAPRSAGAGGGGWQASTSQDIAKGRRTEIDYLNGYVSGISPGAKKVKRAKYSVFVYHGLSLPSPTGSRHRAPSLSCRP